MKPPIPAFKGQPHGADAIPDAGGGWAVSYSQSLKPASDLPEIRHQALVNALCFPHEKVEFAEYVRYTENGIYVTGNCARREQC